MKRMIVACALAGCASTPDYVGVYEITAHHWIAEISVGGNLDCTHAGLPSDVDADYFALLTDDEHPGSIQFRLCDDVASCIPSEDRAWYEVSGNGGIDAKATVIQDEFSPPTCSLSLTTFSVASIRTDTLHIDHVARADSESADNCTTDRARSLASQPTCIWVERLDGRRID